MMSYIQTEIEKNFIIDDSQQYRLARETKDSVT